MKHGGMKSMVFTPPSADVREARETDRASAKVETDPQEVLADGLSIELSAKLETQRVPGGVIDLTQGSTVRISEQDFRNLAQYFSEPIGQGRLCFPMPAGGPAYVVR